VEKFSEEFRNRVEPPAQMAAAAAQGRHGQLCRTGFSHAEATRTGASRMSRRSPGCRSSPPRPRRTSMARKPRRWRIGFCGCPVHRLVFVNGFFCRESFPASSRLPAACGSKAWPPRWRPIPRSSKSISANTRTRRWQCLCRVEPGVFLRRRVHLRAAGRRPLPSRCS
jgi:hypothetical protein